MNYKVIAEEKAQKDILQIVNYLTKILYSKQAADNFLEELKKKFTIIANEPHIYQKERIRNKEYRKASVNNYIVAFFIDEPTKTVHITAIGHSRQRRSNLFKDR